MNNVIRGYKTSNSLDAVYILTIYIYTFVTNTICVCVLDLRRELFRKLVVVIAERIPTMYKKYNLPNVRYKHYSVLYSF